MTEKLVSAAEYAEMHHRSKRAVLQKMQQGGFETARKIGGRWVIDVNEPYIDRRVKSGKYKGFREKYSKKS
jgi:hypothetical protein